MKTYYIFISHSWAYDGHREKLNALLEERSYFKHQDYSIDKEHPINDTDNDRELRVAIENKIKLCSVILVVAGVYASYSKWIEIEIDIAKECSKPIIGVIPWGQEKRSQIVDKGTDEIVRWNSDSVVDAIRKHA